MIGKIANTNTGQKGKTKNEKHQKSFS